MLGAIAGDVIGSVYEARPVKTVDFPLLGPGSRFTDDTVLTVATAAALLGDGDYAGAYRSWYRRYPAAGYGGLFVRWARAPGAPAYGSFGNGSAMRVSPVGWAAASLEEALAEAGRSARVTHDHPEGIRGAQAVAAAVFLARSGLGKPGIRRELRARFSYDLDTPLDRIRPSYRFDVTCQGSVPQALRAFLESEDFEHAVRLAVSLGGDSDTLACIAGGVAESHYGGVPGPLRSRVEARLDEPLLAVIREFRARYPAPAASG